MATTRTFTAQVDKWVLESQKRLRAVRNASIEKVVNDAQLPVGKGGRMRIDTGFLRASGQMQLGGLPSGPVRGSASAEPLSYDDGSKVTPVALILAGASFGTDIYFGWTADYARAREAQDGFLRLAAQKWPQFVEESVRMAKSRSGT